MDANSTKALDFSMLLRLTSPRQKKKNCKYRRGFRKSVQVFSRKRGLSYILGQTTFAIRFFCIFAESLFFDYSDATFEG